MDWNDRAIADWESKWLDPDYDMATMRYRDDEEDEFVDDEIDDALNYIFEQER